MKSKTIPTTLLRLAFLILAITTFARSSSLAALTTGNIGSLPSPDGQNITIDSLTNLEWLDPAVTANQSVTQVTARFATDLAGFRYATREEARVFFSHFPTPLPTAANYSFSVVADGGASYDAAKAYFGITKPDDGTSETTVGFTADAADGSQRYLYETGKQTFLNPNRSFTQGTDTFDLIFPTANGHWLVQSVPEPSVFALATFLGLVCYARYRTPPG